MWTNRKKYDVAEDFYIRQYSIVSALFIINNTVELCDVMRPIRGVIYIGRPRWRAGCSPSTDSTTGSWAPTTSRWPAGAVRTSRCPSGYGSVSITKTHTQSLTQLLSNIGYTNSTASLIKWSVTLIMQLPGPGFDSRQGQASVWWTWMFVFLDMLWLLSVFEYLSVYF